MKKFLMSSCLKELFSILFVIIAIYFSSRALFHEGFFRTIDDITTVRIEHMSRELKRGEWQNTPVRYGADLSHSYGYFVYLFYAPLVYYVGALGMIVGGLSDIMATKLVYVIPLIIGPLIFYWAVRQKLDRFPSLIATVLYTLFPFRGFDTYIRGGVGEAWAMMFFPGVIGSLFLLGKKNRWSPYLLTICLTLSLISHNLSGILIFGFTLLYGVSYLVKNMHYWGSVILAIGLSTFFWLPAVMYGNLVQIKTSFLQNGLVTNYLTDLPSLLTPTLSYGIHDKTSVFLFYVLILGLIMGLLRKSKDLIFWSLSGVSLYMLMSKQSTYLWDATLSISQSLQFPWRLLIILSSIIPLTLGFTLQLIKLKIFRLALIFIVIFLGNLYLPTFRPQEYSYYYNYNAEDTGPCATSVGKEFLGSWVKECISVKPDFILKFPQVQESVILHNSPLDTSIQLTNAQSGYVEAQRYYFPGWKIYIDNEERPLDYQYYKHGTFRTKIDAGSHLVRVVWQKTQLMWTADIVSLLGLLVLVGAFIREVKRH